MNFTPLQKLIFSFFTILFLPVLNVSAQELHPDDQAEESWINDVPCKGQESEKIGIVGNRNYRICIKFNTADLRPNPGRTNYVPVVFESYVKRGAPNLTKIIINRDHETDYPGLIIDTIGDPWPPRNTGQSSSMTEFATKIGILSNARTDIYPLSLFIASASETGRKVEFSFPVLGVDKSLITLEKTGDTEIDCWAGSQCSDLQLHFKNDLPYKVTVSDVSVTSDDLLEAKPLVKVTDAIDANSETDITFPLKAKGVTFTRAFNGFGKPQLKIKVDFKDDFGRVVHTESKMGFSIRPNLLILAIFLVLGAVVGTLVRIDLGRLQRAGVISRKERIVFAVTTFASGILVCLIALFANIKLIVLNENAYSAWDPKTLFFTALIATVSGLPILYAYLKIPRQATSTQSPPQPPPGNEAPSLPQP